MKLTTFLTLSLPLLIAQVSSTRRHHDALAARYYNSTTMSPRGWNDVTIYKPGDKWGHNELAIATSYDATEYGGPMSGACGWGGISRHKKQGGVLYGAAQMYSVFGNGKSCGSCIKLTPTEQKLYPGIGSFKFVVVNSCPPPCKSVDLEIPGIVAWLKRARVGQLNIVGEVVPCNFKNSGIFIEVYQYTSTIYDLRLNLRGNSGAVALAEIACAGTGHYLDLKKENPLQYTLANGNGASPQILKCKSFDLRLTNFVDEKIFLPNIPNKLYQPAFANKWFNTNNNFVKT